MWYKVSFLDQAIGLMSRVFANGMGDWGSIPGQVISKTQKKMVLDAALLCGGALSTGCGCVLHGSVGCVPPLDTSPLASGGHPPRL